MPEQTTSEASEEAVLVLGRVAERARLGRKLPRRGRVKRYIFTAAQNNTYVHEDVWINLLALADHYDAELIVGTNSYQKARHGAKAVKRGTKLVEDSDHLWYDPAIVEHIIDDPVQLAPGLIWCGEQNIIPTSMDPLSQLESYNGTASNIVPHQKLSMKSVASLGDTKFNYTTGTVTQRNYLQKKVGLLSERYHSYGGLLVEVCWDGSWYVRQLEASEADGWSIRDLRLKVKDGVVTDGNPVEAVAWGDIHVRVIAREVDDLAFGAGGMLDYLRPSYQVLHDVLDQRARNHHEAKDPLAGYRKWRDGAESVDDEVRESVHWMMKRAWRDWCHTVVVPSNHHEALERWLKEADIRHDHVNKRFYHEAWIALLDDEPDIYHWACKRHGLKGIEFLETDKDLVICKHVDGVGIGIGQHGHLGPNGARGNRRAFTKLGRPMSHGHEHTAGIDLGVWTAGTSSRLRIGYNRGPSSWSWSHVVHYPEGTRQLITFWNGRWRA